MYLLQKNKILFNFYLKTLVMKTIGTIILVIGIVGTIMFGYQAMQDSESFSVLGMDVAVSSADWTPLIVSVVVLLVGAFLMSKGRK